MPLKPSDLGDHLCQPGKAQGASIHVAVRREVLIQQWKSLFFSCVSAILWHYWKFFCIFTGKHVFACVHLESKAVVFIQKKIKSDFQFVYV